MGDWLLAGKEGLTPYVSPSVLHSSLCFLMEFCAQSLWDAKSGTKDKPPAAKSTRLKTDSFSWPQTLRKWGLQVLRIIFSPYEFCLIGLKTQKWTE